MLQEHFHPLVGINEEERLSKNIRTFIGDGSPVLKVPGLQEVKSVRVGTQPIPLTMTEKVPTDPDAKNHETVEHALIKLTKTEDGTPVLMRSIKSNNGMWQDGVTVFVGGKWKDDAPTAPPVDPKLEAKAKAEADAKLKAEAEEKAKAKTGS